MIIGLITVFKCDGEGCEVHKTVVSDRGDEIDHFEQTWFVGIEHHFCPACRGKVGNQAAMASDEKEIREFSERIIRSPRMVAAMRAGGSNV